VLSLSKSTQVVSIWYSRVSTTWPVTRCQTQKIFACNVFFLSFFLFFFGLLGLKSFEDLFFFGQQLVLFVHENFCNCAQRFFKTCRWIFRASTHSDFSIPRSATHFTRAQVTITRPITWCKCTDYSPKVGRVIETRGQQIQSLTADLLQYSKPNLQCTDLSLMPPHQQLARVSGPSSSYTTSMSFSNGEKISMVMGADLQGTT
jgi:hypothetical protein